MTNWEQLKVALGEELAAWEYLTLQIQAQHDKSIDIAERNKMKSTLAVFSCYIEVTSHIIEAMEAIEGADGGSTEKPN